MARPVDRNRTRNQYDGWHAALGANEAGHAGSVLQSWHHSALRQLPDLNGRDVLEIGCGRGDFTFEICRRYPRARITAVDFSPQAIALGQSKHSGSNTLARFMVGDAQALALESGAFDWVVSCECIEHVMEPGAMAAEIMRVLRPGGGFVITTENYFNGMLLGWLDAKLKSKPFDSGAGVQPIEHFFLFWRVRRMLRRSGLRVTHMESHHFQWLLLPGVDPAKLCTRDFGNPYLKRLFRPFGRHFTYVGQKPAAAKQ